MKLCYNIHVTRQETIKPNPINIMKTAAEIKAVVDAKYNEFKHETIVQQEVERITEKLYEMAQKGAYNEFNLEDESWWRQMGGSIKCEIDEKLQDDVCQYLEKLGFRAFRNTFPNRHELLWVQWGPSKN